MSISPSVVRANNSSLRGYLAVFRGAQVLEATLTANPTRESAVNLSISIVSGSISDVQRGYRVQVFAADGVTFKGETHVRWFGTLNGTNLPVREFSQSEFLFFTGDVVRVFAFIADADKLVEDTDQFDPDGQPVGTYNSAPAPLACSGGADAGFVDGYETDTVLTYRTVITNGAPSMVVDATSTPGNLSHLWTLPTGVAFAPGSSATDASPTLRVNVGEYTVYHDVTDNDNGQAWRQCVTYSVYDGVTRKPVSVIMENPPSSTPEQGWTCNFRALDFLNLTDAPDGSFVVFFVRQRINGAWQSLGGAPGRSAIKLAGYLSHDESDLTPQLQYQRFEVISPITRLSQLPGFSKLLIQSLTPNEWSRLGSLTTLRATIQLLRMYTWFLDGVHDLIISQFYANLPYPELWLQKESPRQQVDELADGCDARFVCWRSGLFFLGPQLPLLPVGTRASLTNVYTYYPRDVARMVLRRNHLDTVETLELHATGASAAGNIATVPPVFSRAPGSPGQGAEFITIERVIATVATPQTDANARCGRRYAQRNGVDTSSVDGSKCRLIELDVELRDVYDFLDFDDQIVRFANFRNPRGLDLTVFDWALARVTLDYGSGKVIQTFTPLTDSPAGGTYVPPPDPLPPATVPYPPAPAIGTPTPEDLYGLPSSIGDIALFDSGNSGYWTGEMRLAAPDWLFTDLTTAPTWNGTLVQFIQNAFLPADGVAVSTTYKFQLQDFGNTPVLANDDPFAIVTPLRSLQSERGAPGFFACVSNRQATAGGSRIDVDVTTDSGVSWTNYTPSNFGTWAGGVGDGYYPGCYVSPHTPGKVITSAWPGAGVVTGRLMVSPDYGATWSALNGNTFLGLANVIHVAYQDVAEAVVYHGGVAGAGQLTRLYRDVGGVQTDISPVVGGVAYGPDVEFGIKTCDVDQRSVVLAGRAVNGSGARGVFLSRDGGNTWTAVIAPDPAVLYTCACFAGDNPNVIFLWGATGAFAVSYNGGVSFQDKSVPLGLGAGTLVNIAGYKPS
jgi:hypothetical protein